MTKKDKRRERTDKKCTGRENKKIVRNINYRTEKQKQFGELETVLRKKNKREREKGVNEQKNRANRIDRIRNK